MKDKLKERVLSEAIRIGEDLYNKRIEDEDGIYWKTMSVDSKSKKIVWNISENIYSGVSGIALFYLSLYKVTNEIKYLNICKNTMNWVVKYCKDNETYHYSFLTGRMSAVYALIKLNEITKDKYIEKALNIAKGCDVFISGSNTSCEYLNGASGTLLTLLHLHNATKEEWLLDKIDLYIKYILDKAHYGKDGIHWDRNLSSIKSLCGFSHGAAGIGFVFLELGNYFSNPVFYYIAEQSFKYESKYFDKREKNWVDLRNSFYDEKTELEHKTAFLEKRYDFFLKGKFMSAWCHGAPGIGLARFRAYELLKKNIYLKEVNICADKIIDGIILNGTYILCHGLGGNLDLLIIIMNSTNEKKMCNKLSGIIEKMLNNHLAGNIYQSGLSSLAGGKEDTGLFLGNAGIGYFYLRTIENNKIESILLPVLKDKCSVKYKDKKYSNINVNDKEIRERIINKRYKRTLTIYNLYDKEGIKKYLNKPLINFRKNELNSFIGFFNKVLRENKKSQEIVRDIFRLETKKLVMDYKLKSYSLINARNLFQKEVMKDILNSEELLLKSHLIVNSEVSLLKTKYNWDEIFVKENIDIRGIKKNPTLLLLRASVNGTEEMAVSAFCYNILSLFKKGMKAKDVINKILKLFESDSNEYLDKVKEKTIEQIKNMMLNNILLMK